MVKKIIATLTIFTLMFVGTGCANSKMEPSTEKKSFKEEYETLNGGYDEELGDNFRTVKISKHNPMVPVEASDIVKKINNKETFVVFFGYAECPWCRSMVSTMVKTAKNNKIKKIYYVDVQNIRDQLEYNDESKTFGTATIGSDDYMKLIKKLKNILDDYMVSYTSIDGEEKEINAGEKRIYAPTLIYVKKGKAVESVDGLSDKQETSSDKLTKEMKEDMTSELNEFFSKVKTKVNACSVEEDKC